MTERHATELIVRHAHEDAQRSCERDGLEVRYSDRHGVLTAYLTEMEQRNETPAQFVARRGWSK